MVRCTRVLAVAVAALTLLAGSSASATYSVWFDVVGGSGPTDVTALGYYTAGNHGWDLGATPTAPVTVEGMEIDGWTTSFSPDPFVTNNIVVTNTTGLTQTFVATVLLNIPLFNYDSIIASSVGVTTTDSNGNNVLSFANNGATAIYQGLINGSTALNLNPPGLPYTTASCLPFPNTAGCSASGTNGVPFLVAGPGGATQIGITLTFDLSPGDSAGLTSRFEIIPEPETAFLLALGLVGLVLAGRRRR